MNGLVYSLDDDADNTPVYWMGIAVAALAIHALALFCLTIKEPTLAAADDVVTVSLDDSFLNLPPEPAPVKPEVPSAPAMKEVAAAQPKPVPAPPVAEPLAKPAVVEPLPAVPEKPKAVAAPTPPPAVTTPPPAKPQVAQPTPRPLNEKALPSMVPQLDTAFDEDTHVSKKAPDKAYLSDRTSTAADRGPKNLPQGDPYIDKGESNRIRYMGKRGEGNLPPIDSDAASGSVKVEGAKVAGDSGGKQAPDFSKSVSTAEIKVPKPVDPIAKEATQPDKVDNVIPQDKPTEKIADKVAKVVDESPIPPPSKIVKPDIRPIAKPKPPEPDPIPSDTGTLLPPPKRPKEVAAEPVQLPTNFDLNEPKRPTPAPRPQNEVRAADQPVSKPAVADPVTQQGNLAEKALDNQAELDRFEAALNGVNSVGSGNGTPGTGANLRKGEQGHEGNGAMRPGDDNAVSDVTTINLESSSSELGDPRFAKRFDPKTAYIKRFARRIDGKWKADIAAHLRSSLIPGSVSIRIVLRKDGKLIEASEVHRDRGVRDDYVATAKRAVEEAANPSADPFPSELSNRDSIEYTFTFLYN